jgi:hypothetical protein
MPTNTPRMDFLRRSLATAERAAGVQADTYRKAVVRQVRESLDKTTRTERNEPSAKKERP